MKPKTLAGWLVLLAVLAYLFVPMALKVRNLKRQSADLEDQVHALSAKNQKLANELRLLKEDPVYIEYVARRTFNKAKEGEVIYRLVPPDEASQ